MAADPTVDASAASQPSLGPDGEPPGIRIQDGDLVMMLLEDGKRLTVKAGQGRRGTHFGDVNLQALVGMEFGRATHTNTGSPVYLLRLSLQDHIMSLKRITQIIYPKDIGTILLKLGIGQGSRVLECGTGSGALTMSMAWMVGPTGKIYSYEREKPHMERARYNLARVNLLDRVELKQRDMADGSFDEVGVDAAFLDVREPPDVLPKVTRCLSPGGVLGFLVPTANQVSDVLRALETAPYCDTEVMETLFRKYKVNANRFRPEDRMIGHTGYLIFTRRIVPLPDYSPNIPRARVKPGKENKGVEALAVEETPVFDDTPGGDDGSLM
jgi:tRNA (adenine57-N1/adenine58-N1)-methyltransferase